MLWSSFASFVRKKNFEDENGNELPDSVFDNGAARHNLSTWKWLEMPNSPTMLKIMDTSTLLWCVSREKNTIMWVSQISQVS